MPNSSGLPRCDGIHTDAFAGQLPSRLYGQSNDAALGRAVSRLSDLPFVSGYGSGVDNHAALTVCVGFTLRHISSRKPQNIESSDQVDLDYLAEALQRHNAVSAQNFGRRANTRAADRNTTKPMGFAGGSQRRLRAFSRAHIAVHEDAANVCSNFLALLFLKIKDGNFTAGRSQRASCAFAKPGRATCYNGRYVFEFHHLLPSHQMLVSEPEPYQPLR